MFSYRFALILSLLLTLTACGEKQNTEQTASGPSLAPATTQAAKQWIAGWQATSQLSVARAGTATVVANGYMYVIGGVDGKVFVPQVEFAKINADGSLSAWQQTSPLKEERGFIDAVTANGYIYVVGGGNGPNGKNLLRSVERAKLMEDGQLGPWETEANGLITPRRCSKVVLIDGNLYALGGFAGALLDTVERAKLGADGHVGQWHIEDQTMTIPRYVNTVKAAKGYTYVIGGHDQMKGVGITDVEWTKPQADGEMKDWRPTASLQVGRYGLSSAKYKNRVYAIGGLTGLEYLNSIEVSEIGETGELGPWRYTTPLFEPRATFSTLVHKDWIYIIGGTNEDRYLNSVVFASVNEQGDIGFWGSQEQANQYAQAQDALKHKKTTLPNQGTVQHVQYASMYTYANVKSNLGDIWLAGPKIELKAGDKIGFSKGVSMSNFYSKELKQQFPVILFVSKIEKSE